MTCDHGILLPQFSSAGDFAAGSVYEVVGGCVHLAVGPELIAVPPRRP